MTPADIRGPAVAAAFCDVGRTAEVQVRHLRFASLLDPVREAVSAWMPRGRDFVARLME